jgi:hypothetical protein
MRGEKGRGRERKGEGEGEGEGEGAEGRGRERKGGYLRLLAIPEPFLPLEVISLVLRQRSHK